MSLLDSVREAGVIGAGGAGFPTHVKLASEAEYILLNGAECEPLLRVDQQLMAIYPDKIIKGFNIAGKLVKAKKAIIGVKDKHKEVIEILNNRIMALGLQDYMSVGILPDIYPAGDEQVLVYELTGRIVPEMGIPIQVGCVVLNTETALNVYNAESGKSVTKKYITLAGDIPERKTLKVAVGTPIIDVLKKSGITDFSNYAIIDGGPMMGPLLKNYDGYITKKNKGFVILKKDHPLIQKKLFTVDQAKKVNKAACEQCRMCTDLCPRFLIGHVMEPHKTMRILNYGMEDTVDKDIAQLCCQCNLCEYFSCPAGVHPKLTNDFLKEKLKKENIKFKPSGNKYKASESREYRLVPSKRLIARISLSKYDQSAPMTNEKIEPEEIHILMSQHVGAPAQATVNIGDNVTEGQLIGKIPDNSLGATVHTSISGNVTEVNDNYIAVRRG